MESAIIYPEYTVTGVLGQGGVWADGGGASKFKVRWGRRLSVLPCGDRPNWSFGMVIPNVVVYIIYGLWL